MEFSSPEDEAEHLSALIERGIREEGGKPRDYCIIVRQLTGDMVKQLKSSLATRDIKLRDESLLQDILAEPVVKFLLAILRLSTRVRDAEAWEVLTTEISALLGLTENEDGAKIEFESKRLVQYAKKAVKDENRIKTLPVDLVEIVGDSAFRSVYRQYGNGSYLKKTIADFSAALQESMVTSKSVREAVDDLIGNDVVPAMTIHKSKGLEFRTVIFLGLEDSQWWNFSKQPDEEKRGFFVAFSRAIEHVYFTYADVRDERWGRRIQRKSQVNDLYTILQLAGVETENHR